MANQKIIQIPRSSDVAIIDLFLDLGREYGTPSNKINIHTIEAIEIPLNGEEPAPVQQIREINSSLIETASVNINGLSITFYRGGNKPPESKSALIDDLSINVSNSQLTSEQKHEILGKISAKLGPFEADRVAPGLLNDDQKASLAIHGSVLERLEVLAASLTKDTAEWLRSSETEYRTKSAEKDAELNQRWEELQKENENHKSRLLEREQALQKKQAEIDDRENTHVRREIRKDILKEVKTRSQEFTLTKNTRNLRLPIHVICGLLLVFLGYMNVLTFSELIDFISLGNSSGQDVLASKLVVLGVKGLLLTIGLGASAVFYLRWMNSWFNEHANAEFRLKQFQLDIERASWVVETALEWKDVKGSAIPNELLEPLTRKLFCTEDEKAKELHPADQLASALMGTASKVRLAAGDSEVELDGKNLAKAK